MSTQNPPPHPGTGASGPQPLETTQTQTIDDAGQDSSGPGLLDAATSASRSQARMSYKFQRLREKLRQAVVTGELTGKLPGKPVYGPGKK